MGPCGCSPQGAAARDWTEYLGGLMGKLTRNGDAPWFCHDLDCPHYEVVEKLDGDVELRRYSKSGWLAATLPLLWRAAAQQTARLMLCCACRAGVWASTTMVGPKYEAAVYQGFLVRC